MLEDEQYAFESSVKERRLKFSSVKAVEAIEPKTDSAILTEIVGFILPQSFGTYWRIVLKFLVRPGIKARMVEQIHTEKYREKVVHV